MWAPIVSFSRKHRTIRYKPRAPGAPEKNEATQAEEAVISAEDSPVKVIVIPTNEELVVAREVKRFLDHNRN